MNNFYVLVGSNIKPQENVKKGLNLIKESPKLWEWMVMKI